MLEHNPGQNPRPACTSLSLARLLWFDPIVAPAARLLCPITREAMRKELLWCCSCDGKIRLFRTSQQEIVELSPRNEWISRAPYLRWELFPRTNRTALQP